MDSDPRIAHVLQEWMGRELADDSGEALRMVLEPPASPAELDALERALGFALHPDLRALHRFASGIDLFGHELHPARATLAAASRPWASFAAWAGGDRDWIVCGTDPDWEPGTVVFRSSASGRSARVAQSLATWLVAALEETERAGALLHPQDYASLPGADGLYRRVWEAIR